MRQVLQTALWWSLRGARTQPHTTARCACGCLPPVHVVDMISHTQSFSSSITGTNPSHLYTQAVSIIETAKAKQMSNEQEAQNLYEQACDYLQEAATQGHLEAKGRLGRWKLLGIGPFSSRNDVEGAHKDLHEAAVGENPEAQYWLGRLWLDPESFQSSTTAATATASSDDELTVEELQVYQEADQEKKKQVLKEVRRSRRLARINRNRRDRGLPEVRSLNELSSTDRDRASLYRDLDLGNVSIQADEDRAFYWLEMAADHHGHRLAHVALGNIALNKETTDAVRGCTLREAEKRYERSVFSDKDISLLEWATTIVADGSFPSMKSLHNSLKALLDPNDLHLPADGLFNLGQLYWDLNMGRALMKQHGIDLVNVGSSENSFLTDISLVCFAEAADRHDSSSQFWLGQLYLWGDEERGVSQDVDSGLKYLFSAVDNNHGGAQLYLSRLYRDSSSIPKLPSDQEVANQLLVQACENNEPDAFFELANCYFEGSDGFPQDHEAAFELFVKGGQFGHAECLLNAGVMSYSGIGANQGKRQAFHFYQQAGEMGNLQAWSNLAAMYATGEGGVEKNMSVAKYLTEFVKNMSDR